MFDKEFIMYLAKYIGENDNKSKRYLNAYFMKFLELKNISSQSERVIINIAYRFWNFRDSDIINFIYGDKIRINKSGFLSYYSNIGNTKHMINFLELDNPRKLFYMIEENNGEFYKIYTPLENINESEYSQDELEYIGKVLEQYKKENEYVKIVVDEYNLSLSNTKALLVHEWLGDLLNFKDSHKMNNGYYYVLLNKHNIEELRYSEIMDYLIDNSSMINSIGCSILDSFHNERFLDYYYKKKEKEKPKEESEKQNFEPIQIKFTNSSTTNEGNN